MIFNPQIASTFGVTNINTLGFPFECTAPSLILSYASYKRSIPTYIPSKSIALTHMLSHSSPARKPQQKKTKTETKAGLFSSFISSNTSTLPKLATVSLFSNYFCLSFCQKSHTDKLRVEPTANRARRNCYSGRAVIHISNLACPYNKEYFYEKANTLRRYFEC